MSDLILSLSSGGSQNSFDLRRLINNGFAKNGIQNAKYIDNYTNMSSYTAATSSNMFVSLGGFVLFQPRTTTSIRKWLMQNMPWDTIQLSASGYVDVSISPYIATGLFIDQSGTKAYIYCTDNYIRQLSLPTPWDFTSWSLVNQLVWSGKGDGFGLWFSNDGFKMFVTGNSTTPATTIFQYRLTTAWNLSTAISEYAYDYSTPTYTTHAGQIRFSPNGYLAYLTYTNTTTFGYAICRTFTMSIPFDLRTITGSSAINIDFSQTSTGIIGPLFDKTEKTFFSMLVDGGVTRRLYQGYAPALETTSLWSGSSGQINPNGLTFHPDGYTFYVTHSTSRLLYQIPLAVAWNINSAIPSVFPSTPTVKSFSTVTFGYALTEIIGAAWNDDGTQFYALAYVPSSPAATYLLSFPASTPYDVTTLDSVSFASLDITGVYTNDIDIPGCITFSYDGKYCFVGTVTVVGSTTQRIITLEMSTPWDITTAFYKRASSSSLSSTRKFRGLSWNNSGTTLFALEQSTTDVFDVVRYDMSTAFNTSTKTLINRRNAAGNVSLSIIPRGLFLKTTGDSYYYGYDDLTTPIIYQNTF